MSDEDTIITDHFVYVICVKKGDKQCAPVKVGISATPFDRMASLQTGHFEELAMAFCFAMPDRQSARRIERAFHEVYREHRLKGEWFSMEPMVAVLRLCFAIESFVADVLGFSGRDAENCLDLVGIPFAKRRIAAHIAAQRAGEADGTAH